MFHHLVEVSGRHPVLAPFPASVLHTGEDGTRADIDVVSILAVKGKHTAGLVVRKERLAGGVVLTGDHEPALLNNVGLDDAGNMPVTVLPPARARRLEGTGDAKRQPRLRVRDSGSHFPVVHHLSGKRDAFRELSELRSIFRHDALPGRR